MNHYLMPYERNRNVAYERRVENGSEIEEHEDKCPTCPATITWQRECDEWELLDDGTQVPMLWTSWHTECDKCHGEFVCPYDDGLIYYVGNRHEEEDGISEDSDENSTAWNQSVFGHE